MDMCRFSGLDDHEYRKVAFAFDRIRSHIEEVCQNQTAQQGQSLSNVYQVDVLILSR